MFGKKKVSLREYTLESYQRFFSADYDRYADSLISACGPEFSEGIDRESYLSNFRAVLMELLSIAFSRTLSRDQRYGVFEYEREFLGSHNAEQLETLKRQFNSAFGSDFSDGVRPMAAAFASNCRVDGSSTDDVAKVHYNAFYKLLESFFENLDGIKLV